MSRFVSVAGERVAELAERCADNGRFSRGRALFRKGAVSDLSVSNGSVIASVTGSNGDEYETTIGTALAPPGVIRQIVQATDAGSRRSIDELISDGLNVGPRDIDLGFGCSCADWEEPCKHVVAVLLAFADRVDLDEAELLLWRGIDRSSAVSADSEVPPRSRRPPPPGPPPGPRRGPTTDTQPPSRERSTAETRGGHPDNRTATLSELEALLGDTVMRVPASGTSDSEPAASSLDPVLANFLGIDMTIDPIDVSAIATPAKLFADVLLGPLADLGPELASAVEIIIAQCEDISAE